MDKSTQEQIKEFWEWCGFKYVRVDDIPWHKKPEDYLTNYWYANNHWVYPDGSKNKDAPPIDLNNLFKYAVPKLHNDYKIWLTYFPEFDTYNAQIGDSSISLKDPALALFWAIWEVIHA